MAWSGTDLVARDPDLCTVQLTGNNRSHDAHDAHYERHTDGSLDYLSTIVTTVVNRSCSRPPEGVLGTTPPTNFYICLRKCLLV